MVCLGNICRSPLAEGILRSLALKHQLASLLEIDSAGTAGHTAGSFPDPRSQAVAQLHGITLNHRARKLIKKDFEFFDHILVMDKTNLQFVLGQAGDSAKDKVRLITDFDFRENSPRIVADPYYGNLQHFHDVYEQILHCCQGWLREYFQIK